MFDAVVWLDDLGPRILIVFPLVALIYAVWQSRK